MSHAIINKTKEQYNAIAHDWDLSRSRPSGLKLKQIKCLKNSDRLLDLGCGNGLIVPYVLERGAEYNGIDISGELIKIAKGRYPEADFKIGDATKKLKFKDNSFDWVFSFAVLHHIPTEKLRIIFLKEIYRVLKKGGRASIIVWNLLNDKMAKRFKIYEQLEKNKTNDIKVRWLRTKGMEVQRYIHIFFPEELKKLAMKAGFKDIDTEYYNQAGKKEKNGEELVLLIHRV